MILVDGKESDRLDVRDRGLQYGDGLFETLAVRDGRPRRWSAHLERLEVGCQRLGIPVPDQDVLGRDAERCCAGHVRAVLKLLVTRGSGGRGYRPPAEPRPRRILMTSPWPEYPDDHWAEGVRLRYCDTPLGVSPALAGLKH
ncbi:MAG TPA: aminotransferase class IV, partial [Gammaproteobacteria bacterium]|nr:aminotransferase class IV [Gammaproteobacteria bacterium]